MPVRIELLGPPRFTLDGAHDDPANGTVLSAGAPTTGEIAGGQPLLLCCYLLAHDAWLDRARLVALFWPDDDEGSARHKLSQLLYRCRRLPWGDGLETEAERVRWRAASDLGSFREAIAAGDWQAATACWRGDLLADALPRRFPDYLDWLERERAALRNDWREATLRRSGALERTGRHAEAAALLEALLRHDPLSEEGLQALLRTSALSGRRERALRAFESFEQMLHDELGIGPVEATVRLAEQVRSGELAPGSTRADAAAPEPLPADPTPFVGRDLERLQVGELLAAPGGHLLTILGPGGAGKTRLALQIARDQADAYPDGAVFVPLATLEQPERLAERVAAALGLPPDPTADPLEALRAHLAARTLLLVLDNFEHLLDGVGLVRTLREASPRSRIVVTSRVALGLRGEQLFDLHGLDLPPEHDGDAFEGFGAVTLFLQAARRAAPLRKVTATEKRRIVRVCRRLDGLPLAIELAASWLRVLSLDEIEAELEAGLDRLEAPQSDVPDRHRSLRAVFEHSWNLLAPEERRVLARLAVFRGGFSRQAAAEVADASPRTLLTLVNASLLRRSENGRFERLQLVQQFSEQKLAELPGARDEVRGRHARHYTRLARDAAPNLSGAELVPTLERLERDRANLGAAFATWIEAGEAQAAAQLGGALWRFLYTRRHIREGRALLDAVLALPGAPGVGDPWIDVLHASGLFRELSGDLSGARLHFRRSLALAEEADDDAARSRTLRSLGIIAYKLGELGAARDAYRASLALCRERNDVRGTTASLINLGMLANDVGDAEQARSLLEEALELSHESGDPHQRAIALNNLGNVVRDRGDIVRAEELYLESLQLNRHVGDRHGVGSLLLKLGVLVHRRGDLSRAETLLRDGHAVLLEIGDPGDVAVAQLDLGRLMLDRGERVEAERLLGAGLATVHALGQRVRLADALASAAALAAAAGEPERALHLAGAAAALRQSVEVPADDRTGAWLEHHLQSARDAVGEAGVERAVRAGRELPLEAAVALAVRPPIADRDATPRAPSDTSM